MRIPSLACPQAQVEEKEVLVKYLADSLRLVEDELRKSGKARLTPGGQARAAWTSPSLPPPNTVACRPQGPLPTTYLSASRLPVAGPR